MAKVTGTIKSVSGAELVLVTKERPELSKSVQNDKDKPDYNPEETAVLSADRCVVKIDGVIHCFADISNGREATVQVNPDGKTFSRIDVVTKRETVHEAAQRGYRDTGYPTKNSPPANPVSKPPAFLTEQSVPSTSPTVGGAVNDDSDKDTVSKNEDEADEAEHKASTSQHPLVHTSSHPILAPHHPPQKYRGKSS